MIGFDVVRITLASLLWATVGTVAAGDETVNVPWAQLRDIDDRSVAIADAPWQVVCFLGTECPLARLYGPRLNALAREFQAQGVRFVAINSNSQDSISEIRQYAAELAIEFPHIKDADQSLARLFQAKRTPEVFVLDPSGRVRYRGRIDDQYQPGIVRVKPTRHELRQAIESLLAGEPVAEVRTEPEGCLITLLDNERAESATVTFTRDVAPILNAHCVECHRPGEIGPFALSEYEEVVGWGDMMLEVIDQRRMPPWHADPNYGHFAGARTFPAEHRQTLATWVEQGMPLGDPREVPAQPDWPAGWHLSEPPQLEIAMRDRPFRVPAQGVVEYQYFVVDPAWEEDRWIRAAQVIPGNASVVHHAIVFVRPPDGAIGRGIGWMGAYVPGQRTSALPNGHARRVPAGSKLVFQMHYTPSGREVDDLTRIGVWFADDDEVTHEVFTSLALDQEFEIPPHSKDFAVNIKLGRFPRQSRLLSATPHMHLRGKSFLLKAHRGSESKTLLSVPDYDFNWQHQYWFEEPLPLDNIDSLEMSIAFDNSSDNPVNPAPDDYVTWGDQTTQEMAVAFFDVGHPRGQPYIVEAANSDSESDSKRRARIQQRVDAFLKQMDTDGDGVVSRDEVPVTFRRFGFYSMDRNGNGQLERSEIESAAARRQ